MSAWNVYSQRSYPRHWVIDADNIDDVTDPEMPAPADGHAVYLLASTATGVLAGMASLSIFLTGDPPAYLGPLLTLIMVAAYLVALALAVWGPTTGRLDPSPLKLAAWVILGLVGAAAGAVAFTYQVEAQSPYFAFGGAIALPIFAAGAARKLWRN